MTISTDQQKEKRAGSQRRRRLAHVHRKLKRGDPAVLAELIRLVLEPRDDYGPFEETREQLRRLRRELRK